LLSRWPSIPIEVEPLAVSAVLSILRGLGSRDPAVRISALPATAPLKTDQDNFIVDAPFPTLLLPQDLPGATSLPPAQEGLIGHGEDGKWEVEALAKEIKLIEGVLSVGIFCGQNGEESIRSGKLMGGQKPVAAYFGMEDGGVQVRRAGKEGRGMEAGSDKGPEGASKKVLGV
jgi:ribose 5-phosphate isomerase A